MKHIEQLSLFEEFEESLYNTEEGDEEFKICYVCKKVLPVEFFPYSHGPQLKKWRRRDCKFCLHENSKIRSDLLQQNPYPNNDYTCPICLEGKVHSITKVKRKWNLDHCHETNTFRGFLCSSCNKALGFFGEDIQVFKRIIRYLEKHRKIVKELINETH